MLRDRPRGYFLIVNAVCFRNEASHDQESGVAIWLSQVASDDAPREIRSITITPRCYRPLVWRTCTFSAASTSARCYNRDDCTAGLLNDLSQIRISRCGLELTGSLSWSSNLLIPDAASVTVWRECSASSRIGPMVAVDAPPCP